MPAEKKGDKNMEIYNRLKEMRQNGGSYAQTPREEAQLQKSYNREEYQPPSALGGA